MQMTEEQHIEQPPDYVNGCPLCLEEAISGGLSYLHGSMPGCETRRMPNVGSHAVIEIWLREITMKAGGKSHTLPAERVFTVTYAEGNGLSIPADAANIVTSLFDRVVAEQERERTEHGALSAQECAWAYRVDKISAWTLPSESGPES